MGANTIVEVRAIMDSIRAIVRALRVSTRDYEETCGLTGAQIFILQNLQASGPISVNELAALTYTHQSTVSEIIGRLVQANLVSKTSSTKDARRLELALTVKGTNTLKVIPGKTAQEKLASSIRRLSSQKRRALAEILNEAIRSSGWAAKSPPLFFEESPERRKRRAKP